MSKRYDVQMSRKRNGEVFVLSQTAKITRKMIEEDPNWRRIHNFYRSNNKCEPIFKIMLSIVNSMYYHKRTVAILNRKHFAKIALEDKNWKTPIEDVKAISKLNSMAYIYFKDFNFAKIDYLTSVKDRPIRIICLEYPIFLDLFKELDLSIEKQTYELVEFVTSPNYKKLDMKRFDEALISDIQFKIERNKILTQKETEYKEKFNHYFEQGIENDNSEF